MSVAGAVVPGPPRTVHGSHGNSRTERRRGARPADEKKCISVTGVEPGGVGGREVRTRVRLKFL